MCDMVAFEGMLLILSIHNIERLGKFMCLVLLCSHVSCNPQLLALTTYDLTQLIDKMFDSPH